MFQSDLLHKKRILITGGGTGLGKGMAHRFLELGATGLHLRPPPAGSIRNRNRTEPRSAEQDSVSRLATFVICRASKQMIDSIWKDGPLDILVNNAAGNFLARTEELSPGAFEAVLGIVLMGTINTTMACGRRWLQAEALRSRSQHCGNLYIKRFRLRGTLRYGQSWGGGPDSQSRCRMGRPRHPHERYCSRAHSHRRSVLPLASTAGA